MVAGEYHVEMAKRIIDTSSGQVDKPRDLFEFPASHEEKLVQYDCTDKTHKWTLPLNPAPGSVHEPGANPA